MGPQASVQLHQLLLSLSSSGTERAPDEYPSILHASLPVPDFIADKAAEKIAVAVINSACSTLPLSSAKSVGMACNTAHMLLDRLDIPRHNFVSMIEAVTHQAEQMSFKKVGVLASPNTIRSGLYRNALAKVGIEVVEPNESQIEELNQLIHEVISGSDANTLRPELTEIALSLQEKGADSILLGCTELPLIGVDVTDIPVIDSLSALAKAMLAAHTTVNEV